MPHEMPYDVDLGESSENYTRRELDIINLFTSTGYSLEFAKQAAGVVVEKDLDASKNEILAHMVHEQLQNSTRKISPIDVEVVLDTIESNKSALLKYFDFVDLKFKSLDVIRKKYSVENVSGRESPVESIRSNTSSRDTGFSGSTMNHFDGLFETTKSNKQYATTPHTLASSARVVMEHILTREIPKHEKFIALGMGYVQMIKRSLNCHSCFPIYMVEKVGMNSFKNGRLINNAVSRVNKSEAILRKYKHKTLRERANNHAILRDFDYGEGSQPSFYENTGLKHRCFQLPEICPESANYALTMFTGNIFSVERLVDIMHVKGIKVLHGFEPLSVSMLRSSTGHLPLFEQTFNIDIGNDSMEIYNHDESLAYRYKYSDFRQFFFERDIVVNDTVYSFTHQVLNDSFLKYTIKRKPSKLLTMRKAPIVDIRDDFVFLKTYDYPDNWTRHSTTKLRPIMVSCHVVIYSQIIEHLVKIDKPEDDIMITTSRYLRTLNTEFIVNGVTYKGFEKIHESVLDKVAVALLIESIRMKVVNNVVLSNSIDSMKNMFKKRNVVQYTYDMLTSGVKSIFGASNSVNNVVQRISDVILKKVTDKFWTEYNIVEFLSYSHLIENPYEDMDINNGDLENLTPFEKLWYIQFKNSNDQNSLEWLDNLVKINNEPEYSMFGDMMDSLDFDTFVKRSLEGVSRNVNNMSEAEIAEREVIEMLSASDDDEDSSRASITPRSSISSELTNTSNSSSEEQDAQEDDIITEGYSTDNLEDIDIAERPRKAMISDIPLPKAPQEIVLKSRDFTKLLRNFKDLADVDLHEQLGLVEHEMTDVDKAIFEAYEYRKFFSACIHNNMQLHAITAFNVDGLPIETFFDTPDKVKLGFNYIRFVDGIEVDKRLKSDKAYIMGYVPISEKLTVSCLNLKAKKLDGKLIHKVDSHLYPKYTGYLIVSELTLIMNDENIANCLGDFERGKKLPKITLVNAIAGSGKTHDMKVSFNPNNFYVGSTKNVVKDLRDALKAQNANTHPFFDFVSRVRTIDSITVNGVKNLGFVDILCFDECFQSHPGEILRVIQLINPKQVKLYGDALQIRFIDRLNIKDLYWKKRLEHFVMEIDYRNVTRRCPVDATMVLSDRFYLTNPLFGRSIKTTSKVMESMRCVRLTNINQIQYFSDVLYLTWTKADAHSVNEAWKSLSLQNKIDVRQPVILTADELKCRTVHTGQGMDVNHVVVIKNSPYLETTAMSPEHLLVAMSRHKVSLTYYTKNIDDPFAQMIKYAKTKKNYSDYMYEDE